ncbi:aminotransferase class I/II-fold pyridoxal phosphate-dependent enzyme [bacterium]|nr:aminotransferase class I/II-fold pyridoxal phosphate-dependent enzyme [bacterium]
MDPLALNLNKQIQESSQAAFDCLSDLGKQMFFPAGILTQSAEAKEKAHRFNATIGIAVENDEPMHLNVTKKFFSNLELKDIYPYAPPGGRPKLRKLWKDKLVKTNPTLKGKHFSTPMVTSALTHGLCIAGDLFVGQNDVVIIPDKLWGVYRLNFVTRKGGKIVNFPMFNSQNGFNIEGFRQTVETEAVARKKIIILLCFPNNPTGYTPLPEEAEAICQIIKEQADKGVRIVTISDDAYFGLFYEDSIKESMFSTFCDLHENVLAVKLDGATKESYVWGFRTGFISFGTKTAKPENLYPALEMKAQGVIRSTVSSCNQPAQAIIETVLEDPEYWENLESKYQIMESRARQLKIILQKKHYREAWEYYPFNSGYFMCLKLTYVDAERLRVHLLDKYGIGTISLGKTDLRVAFSCIEEENLEELFDLIFQAAKELQA